MGNEIPQFPNPYHLYHTEIWLSKRQPEAAKSSKLRRVIETNTGFRNDMNGGRLGRTRFDLESSREAGPGFAERGCDIRSGRPVPLRPRPQFDLYSLNKLPAPDCNVLSPLALPNLFGPGKGLHHPGFMRPVQSID